MKIVSLSLFLMLLVGCSESPSPPNASQIEILDAWCESFYSRRPELEEKLRYETDRYFFTIAESTNAEGRDIFVGAFDPVEQKDLRIGVSLRRRDGKSIILEASGGGGYNRVEPDLNMLDEDFYTLIVSLYWADPQTKLFFNYQNGEWLPPQSGWANKSMENDG